MNESQKKQHAKVFREFADKLGLKKKTSAHLGAQEQASSWLYQFPSEEQQYMLEVIRAIQIKSREDIDYSIKKLAATIIKILSNRHAEARYLGIGASPASSGNHFLYPLLLALRLDPSYAATENDIPELISNGTAIVIIDDIVGSGNQAIKYSKRIFVAKQANSIYGCLFGNELGLKKIESEGNFARVFAAKYIEEKDNVFSDQSLAFPDSHFKEEIKRIAVKHGEYLYPDGPLGYDDSGLLISFPHNTPNNSLPIIWAGVYSESPANHWIPLIERIKAPKPLVLIKDNSLIVKQEDPPSFPDKQEHYSWIQTFDSTLITDTYVEPTYEIILYRIDDVHRIQPKGFLIDASEYLKSDFGILILSSAFGCGKTFLSKYLDLSGAFGLNTKVKFISSLILNRFLENANESIFLQLIKECSGLIIDAVDELVIDHNEAGENLLRLCCFVEFARKAGVKILLNIRVSDANMIENTTIKSIIELLDDSYKSNTIPVFRLSEFKKNQIVTWLTHYYRDFLFEELTFDRINAIHKRLGYAVGTPLFLYRLAVYHQNKKSLSDIYSVYQLYDLFVTATVSGRFQNTQSDLSTRGWQLAHKYSVFLEEVASRINNSKTFRDSQSYQNETDFDWRLDANDMPYVISDAELTHAIEFGYAKFFNNHENSSNIKSEDYQLELLNNYFFVRSQYYIGFKDNNILFFLIAKSLFRALQEIARTEDENIVDASLLILAKNKAHPQVIEILLKRIKAEGEYFRAALSRAIDNLIRKNRIIQLTGEAIDRISGGSINRDIILCIVLLHVKKGSYDQLDYFLTRLSWLASGIKNHDSMYGKLIARFFRELELKKLEFRRLNCDDYNFKNSFFANITFIQCKLFSSIFDETEHFNSRYILCDFGGVKDAPQFRGVSGDLSFDNCRIGCLPIYLEEGKSASFKLNGCSIEELYISARNANSATKFSINISNSNIKRIFLENIYLLEFSIVNSTIQTISDKNSRGKIGFRSNQDISSIEWGHRTGTVKLIQC